MINSLHGGDVYGCHDIIDYSANINCFGMPAAVRQAAIEGVEQSCHYPDILCRRLKEEIARMESRKGRRVLPEQVICGNGASELIYALAHAAGRGRALLPVPCFLEYERALQSAGWEITFHDLKKENGYRPEESFLEKLTPETDMVFLCNPNNPTGVLTDPHLLKRIIEKCGENQILLVMDECFLDFVMEKEAYEAGAYLEDTENLFILKAFTKLFAMPGLRLGYGLCGSRELLHKMEYHIPPWNVSVPAQMAGCAACKETAYVKKSVEAICAERERVKEKLLGMGFQVTDGAANFLFFHGKAGLAEYCMRQGYQIRDCSNFRGLSAGDYRIAIRTPEENDGLLQVIKNRDNTLCQE